MKLTELWEVWIYIVLVTLYILVRLRETDSNGVLGSDTSVLAHTVDHPIQRQEGYWQLARLDARFTEFALRGAPKADEAKGVKAMILCGEEWQAMADYLGSSEDVDYLTFQTQMLKRDRERRLFGLAYEQSLADQLSGRAP